VGSEMCIRDRNEYSIGGADQLYALNPDTQLNDWPTESADRTSHYGASFLFMTYFLDRFGEEVTKALVGEAANGLESIDKVLAAFGKTDTSSGGANPQNHVLGADDVFADWVIASYLQDDKVEDGRYIYHNYPEAPNPKTIREVEDCPLELEQRQVRQYGVEYIAIQCPGNYTLHFEGYPQVAIFPENPHSGGYAFYSNRGDESDMTLTRTFDFRGHSGPLTLTYWTWYDLEKDYDYLYLTSSLDGEDWQILTTPSGTADDPSGNSYGWAYNGWSGDNLQWIQERVDISRFAGQQVQLRFEYVTDEAVYGDGFLLDDVAVPEIDYFADFENDDGGWEANGFARIQNTLPQTFRLALINIGEQTTVKKIELPEDNKLNIPIHIDDELIIVVSGTTRFTRQKAIYQFSILP
jgi:immune inhibitor A